MSPFCHSNLYGITSQAVNAVCCSSYVPLLLSAVRYCMHERLHSATLVQAQADKAKVFFGGAMKAGVAAGVAAMKWRMNMPGADEQRVRCSLRCCKCAGVRGGVLAICLAGSHPCSCQQPLCKRVLESSWDTLGADFCSFGERKMHRSVSGFIVVSTRVETCTMQFLWIDDIPHTSVARAPL
jgi:hypothetical protein